MIRTLTIVENNIDGKIEYNLTGNLPLADAAQALVVFAYNIIPEQPKEESENER